MVTFTDIIRGSKNVIAFLMDLRQVVLVLR